MSFSDEDASAWNVFAAEEHLGGSSSSLGRRRCEGIWRTLAHLSNTPTPNYHAGVIDSKRRAAPM